jgi:hypothetical protein
MESWASRMLAGAALALAVSVGFFMGRWPGDQPSVVISSSQINETPIAENEIQLYIDVYAEMQRNHDLQIEDALKARGVSVGEFREIERRIQNQSQLVKRVRDALIEQAKSHAASLAFPAPAPQ